MRTCGTKGNMCRLCCTLLPITSDPGLRQQSKEIAQLLVEKGVTTQRVIDRTMKDFDKPAGKHCPHECAKGCRVYKTRPFGCRFWSCRWVVGDDTAELQRPDISHYVIDMSPDFVRRGDTMEAVPVVQIWVDPKYPNAHQDPKLREFLKRRYFENGSQAILRYNERDSVFLYYDPGLNMFHEKRSDLVEEKTHTAEDFVKATGANIRVIYK